MFLLCSNLTRTFLNRFVLKEVDLICWGIIKAKIFYKISVMKFSSLELKLSGCAVQLLPTKGLKLTDFVELMDVLIFYCCWLAQCANLLDVCSISRLSLYLTKKYKSPDLYRSTLSHMYWDKVQLFLAWIKSLSQV